jgi:hypothetical protein
MIVFSGLYVFEGYGQQDAPKKEQSAAKKAPSSAGATKKQDPALAKKQATNVAQKSEAKQSVPKKVADSKIAAVSKEKKKVEDPLADKKMLVVTPPEKVKPGRIYLDGISCAVNGPERCQIFCETDKYRHGLAPMVGQTDQEKVEMFAFNELVYQNWMQIMERQKMDPNDNTIVNNYIDGLCRQNNWSMSDLEKILAQSGYTLQEGIKELKKMYAVNYMSEMKMQGIVVPENEIEAYYKVHPLYNEPRVKISRAFISSSEISSKDELAKKIAAKDTNFIKNWESAFWLKESEMAEHMRFLISLNADAISEPLETNGGFEVFKIIAKKPKRLVSLKKRYKEILFELRQAKSEESFKKYKDQLFDSASIVYYSHDAVHTKA